jgi:hypothetical protein
VIGVTGFARVPGSTEKVLDVYRETGLLQLGPEAFLNLVNTLIES